MPGTRPLDSSNDSTTHAGPDFVPPALTIKLALHTAEEKSNLYWWVINLLQVAWNKLHSSQISIIPLH